MRVYIEPSFRGPDEGEGGIRRIVEAQRAWLPRFGIEVVEEIEEADLVATHAGSIPEVPIDIPWIVHTHGLYWQGYDWPRWCHDLNKHVIEAMRRADHVTAPSEWVAQALRRGMWLRPTVLYHGIDPEGWEPSPDPGDYVLWNKNRPDPVCDPTPVAEMAHLAPDLNFVTTFGQGSDNIRVTGKVTHDAMRDLVRNAGVYLCTTRETFGIGTLEAMAAGVPVVGWAWGGQREIIQHGQTGWLCPPGDFEGLIEGVRWALKHHKSIGRKAMAVVQRDFTWATRMEAYAKLYQAQLDAKRLQRSGPTVSVVVPCYNLAGTLPDTIKSLQAQTMQDWECIVVNDASPDDTAKVAAELASQDPRIKVVTNRQNLYLAGALNEGVKASTGRYIIDLDADNMLEPWTLDVLSNALEHDRGIHVAYGACRFVLEDGVTRDTSVSPDGVSGWPQDFDFRGQMIHRNQIPSTCMYRREVWYRTGGFRRRCRTAEDAENWTRVASLGFVPKKVTSRVTLIYRQRPDSMSRVEADWDWTGWFPWSRHRDLVPFGVKADPPHEINEGIAWHVYSGEPALVTVVIPVGPGHEALLIDALDSVEAQTFRAWDCIVVNDTGHPLDIPHSWATVLDTVGGVGPGAARNLGLSKATTPLFLPLDADDYLQPDALALMVPYWREFGGYVYGQWYDDKGDVTDLYDPPEYDARLLTTKGAINAVTALYPMSAWKEVKGFDEVLTHWEDWDFLLRIADIGVCGTKVEWPIFTYRKATGERREANMAQFEKGKSAILSRWQDIWSGRRQLMACGSCPGGGGQKAPTPPLMAQQSGQQIMLPRDGYAILEFLSPSAGTRTFKGQSGTHYRFGSDPGHKRKYVLGQDVEALMSLRDGGQPMFRVMSAKLPEEERPPEPQLVAAGPPRRELPDQTAGMKPLAVSELRRQLSGFGLDDVRKWLKVEESQPKPRPSVVAMLTGRLEDLTS